MELLRTMSKGLAASTLVVAVCACGTSDGGNADGSSSGASSGSSGGDASGSSSSGASSGASSGTTSSGGSSGASGDAGSPDAGNDAGGNDAGPAFVPFAPHPGGGLALGMAQSCAVTVTGKVKCWGSGTAGGIGVPPFPGCNPSCGPIVATEIPGVSNVSEISVAIFDRLMFYRTGSGDLFRYGTSSTLLGGGATGLAWTFESSVLWVARGTAGRFRGNVALTPDPSPLLTDSARYAAGYRRACATFPTAPTKEVVCWTGDGVAVAQAGVSSARQVDTSSNTACAALANGRARCWGGAYGAAPGVDLGLDGVMQLSVHPTLDVPLPVEDVLKTHSCAVLSTGALVCWAPSASPTPTAFGGIAGAAEVAIGNGHACVRTVSGSAYCWGNNHYGQLGTGTVSPQGSSSGSALPVLVLGF